MTHNFGVVADLCDSVVVMKQGAVVEQGPVHAVLRDPQHAYTQSLLASTLDGTAPRRTNDREFAQQQEAARWTEKILEVDGLVVEFPGRRRSEKVPSAEGSVDRHRTGRDRRARRGIGLRQDHARAKRSWASHPWAEGSIEFEGRSLVGLTRKQRRDIDVQAVFQDPYTSLNPAMTIGDILAEPLTVRGTSDREARVQVHELLDAVGLPVDAAGRRPNEFSGGQRQRIAIARSLALDPKLIVCDEPVSALDLSTQAKVLDLFIDIQRRTGVAYLFISHDLMVVRHISHRIAVMYHGDIVEFGDGEQVTDHPEHPYTQRLLAASPVSDPVEQRNRRELRHELMEAEG